MPERTGIVVSVPTMHRAVQRLGISHKKTTFASEQDIPRIQGRRYEFRDWLLSVDPRNLVFVDESGVNLGMARLRARAMRGKRAVGYQARNTGENLPLLGALSLEGLIATMSVKASVDTDVFLTYLTTVLLPQLWLLSNCRYG